MEPVIEVQHLKKYFPTSHGMLHAVDDVSFTIEKGKTLGVVGESGCGKSTLGRTIIHLHESTAGKIFLEGEDITSLNNRQLRQAREKMQIIFQDPYSSLNARQTIESTIRGPALPQEPVACGLARSSAFQTAARRKSPQSSIL